MSGNGMGNKIFLVFTSVVLFPKYGESDLREYEKSMRKQKTFQVQVFLTYFARRRNRYNSQNMGGVNSNSAVKLWENTDITELCVS